MRKTEEEKEEEKEEEEVFVFLVTFFVGHKLLAQEKLDVKVGCQE